MYIKFFTKHFLEIFYNTIKNQNLNIFINIICEYIITNTVRLKRSNGIWT